MHASAEKTDPAVRLVSFTVDPKRDTPPVLAEYAKKFGNDNNSLAHFSPARSPR